MDDRTRALVRLSAALTADGSVQVEIMDRAAEVAPREAEEVLLQSYLFLGYPTALNALALWRRRTGRTAPEPTQENPALWPGRGEAVCRAVYAGHYERLRELMGGIHPDLDRWAVVEGYGKVLGRPELDLETRELCVAAQLAGTDATRQLHSHLRGCLNVGATPARIDAALESVEDLIGERADQARRVWQRVRDRYATTEGG